MHLGQTIPALPVKDMPAAVRCYRDKFGFRVVHEDTGFAVLLRDDAEIHLWESSDSSWESREWMQTPVCSGAESFIAGTASCRIQVDEVDDLYAELKAKGVLHKVSRVSPQDTEFGTREFATLDMDGNLISFFRWDQPRRPHPSNLGWWTASPASWAADRRASHPTDARFPRARARAVAR